MDLSNDELTRNTLAHTAATAAKTTRMAVIGVGGAGVNAVGYLAADLPPTVSTVVMDTDIAALNRVSAGKSILLGAAKNRGLSSGGDVAIGRAAAEADSAAIDAAVADMDVVFLIAGMGRGTGGGATALVAHSAAAAGALVIAFSALPFSIEGSHRSELARKGIAELRLECDAVIPLPNDLLLQDCDPHETVDRVFARGNQAILRCVQAIHSMLDETGIINIDLTALREALISRGGKTLFGVGLGTGDNRVAAALEDLLLCPLLHTPDHARNADRLLISIRGGNDLSLAHVNRIATELTERFCSTKDTIIGASAVPHMNGKLEICVIGTTSIDGRAYIPRPSARHSKNGSRATAGTPVESVPVHTSKLPDSGPRVPAQQEEFSFADSKQERGFFQDAERSLVFGEDLDVPTFIRRGIRINL